MNQLTPEDIRYERVKVKDLPEFAEKVLANAVPGQFIPITMQRAVAHAHNPCADDEDVGLMVAYAGEEVAGYFGIMPIMLNHGEQLSKVHWFTTWNVSSAVRGLKVGAGLMREALKIDYEFMIVGSYPARLVSRRFGFHDFEPLTYFRLDMTGAHRLNPITWALRLIRRGFTLLGRKFKIYRPIARAFRRIIAPLTRPIFYRLLGGSQRGRLADISYKEVDQLREDTPEHHASLPPVAFYRGPEVVNWMLKYPWVAEPGESQTAEMDYYFSDVRDRFRQIALEIYSSDGETYLGYAVFSMSRRDGETLLRTLDHHFFADIDKEVVLALALKLGRQFRADTIELPAHLAALLQGSLLGRLLLVTKQRHYQCHPRSAESSLGRHWQEIELDLCDGDMAFS